MYKNWTEAFPELDYIGDTALRQKVIKVNQEALDIGGWTLQDLDELPFTLLIPDTTVSYRTHVRAVAKMADSVYRDYCTFYGQYGKFDLDHDVLMAGALLHDVGKIIEYRRDEGGGFVKSAVGESLRHPFSGAGLAMKHGLPHEVTHIIATHADEGDGRYRSPESVLIYRLDVLNFQSLKAFSGLI